MDNKENEFDFDNDLQQGNNIIDLHERLLFFKKRLKEFNQNNNIDWDNIRDKYKEEINYINDEIKIKYNLQQPESLFNKATNNINIMENTTYYTENVVNLIFTIYNDSLNVIDEYEPWFHIHSNYDLLNSTIYRNEIDTYLKQPGKGLIIDNILDLIKESQNLYQTEIRKKGYNHFLNLKNELKKLQQGLIKEEEIETVEAYELRTKLRYILNNDFELIKIENENDFVNFDNDKITYKYDLYFDFRQLETYFSLLIEYIDSVRGQSEVKELKIKTPKLNIGYNEPGLNQNQISLLFKVFKDKKTFTNRDIDKTDLSKILNLLSGYEPEPFRQNLSKEYIVISKNPKDYEIIIDKLKEVIKEIEKQKKSIIN